MENLQTGRLTRVQFGEGPGKINIQTCTPGELREFLTQNGSLKPKTQQDVEEVEVMEVIPAEGQALAAQPLGTVRRAKKAKK